MIASFIAGLGPWAWWVLGLILLAAELAAPGVFLIWIGAAAIVVGALSVALDVSGFWVWQVQLLLFAVLSVVFALLGRSFYAGRQKSDEPMLNRRTEGLVGRTATLQEPIREGRGRIRLDDTWWPVNGPDLAAGIRVRVTAAHGSDLTVAAVEPGPPA